MTDAQPGIIAPVPALARYASFSQIPDSDPRESLAALAEVVDGDAIVVGIGHSLALAVGRPVDGLGIFPAQTGPGFDVPSTQGALWCWVRGEDRGDIVHRSREIHRLVASGFEIDEVIEAFRHRTGLDLTGYEDGTENPKGEDAVRAAIVDGVGPGADGSSFVAVQQWVHDFELFDARTEDERDDIMGRRLRDNEEIEDAPESSHVKRTAQESFEPEAFVLRRSMPWADEYAAGLNFVAFGRSFNAFEAQLLRMVGAEDGIVDALFTFTRPVSGAYYWCPPMAGGRLDLRLIGM